MSLLKEILDTLTEAKEISTQFNRLLIEKNFEKEFRDKNIGKNIVLITNNEGEKEGKLINIDKYKIILEINGQEYCYYKNALIGFYAK
ncbi:MAG TPA: hypothetical protein PKW55_01855 [Spirochaetota bacterium]|nr:hypothetical protein [Spirochaetota bacterium]HOM38402.1 hypothetical protein [Spirochaetota bacterium]HPQ48380.1 hypothetical protein [Spirochaetota bacterium]